MSNPEVAAFSPDLKVRSDYNIVDTASGARTIRSVEIDFARSLNAP